MTPLEIILQLIRFFENRDGADRIFFLHNRLRSAT